MFLQRLIYKVRNRNANSAVDVEREELVKAKLVLPVDDLCICRMGFLCRRIGWGDWEVSWWWGGCGVAMRKDGGREGGRGVEAKPWKREVFRES